MPTRTEDIAEKAATREGVNLKLWILGGVVAVLLLFVQAIMAFIMTNAAAKMDGYSTGLNRMLTAVEVMTVRNEALSQRVTELEKARTDAGTVHKTFDDRLRSVETRSAIHDQFMTTHR